MQSDFNLEKAALYLRGDFNVSKTNQNRTSLMNQLCLAHNLLQVNIEHPTYHHFTGGGLSDSHLDRLLYCDSVQHPEVLWSIYCKSEEPFINSHHDLVVSVFSLVLHSQKKNF